MHSPRQIRWLGLGRWLLVQWTPGDHNWRTFWMISDQCDRSSVHFLMDCARVVAMPTSGLIRDVERRLSRLDVAMTVEHRQRIEGMSTNELIGLIWRLARASKLEAISVLNAATEMA